MAGAAEEGERGCTVTPSKLGCVLLSTGGREKGLSAQPKAAYEAFIIALYIWMNILIGAVEHAQRDGA